jgi:hypothetical protein
VARDVFQMTVSSPDANDILVALESVGVTVVERGTTNAVTVYQAPTGASVGPTPASGAVPGTANTFTTGASGGIEFWCDGPKEIDVKLVDSITPKRVADRTFGWNCIPAALASLPGSILDPSGSLALTALGADVRRQLAQLGQVIDWWRPGSSVEIPAGWEICDGRTIAGANHDFTGVGVTGQPITLPDLRNAFVIGANSAKADGAAQVIANNAPTDTAADGPGIRGTGGSNRHALLYYESGMPSHGHPGSSASDGGHRHNQIGYASALHTYVAGGTPPMTMYGAGDIAAGDHAAIGYASVSVSIAGSSNVNAQYGHNNVPKFVGLLKLIKVRLS